MKNNTSDAFPTCRLLVVRVLAKTPPPTHTIRDLCAGSLATMLANPISTDAHRSRRELLGSATQRAHPNLLQAWRTPQPKLVHRQGVSSECWPSRLMRSQYHPNRCKMTVLPYHVFSNHKQVCKKSTDTTARQGSDHLCHSCLKLFGFSRAFFLSAPLCGGGRRNLKMVSGAVLV